MKKTLVLTVSLATAFVLAGGSAASYALSGPPRGATKSVTATPSPRPSASPTGAATKSERPKPSGTPSARPTTKPTATPTARPTAKPSATATATPSTDATTVTLTGGFVTKSTDYGRPVALIAAALGVTEDAFRTAFSGVTPSTSGAPDAALAQQNKAALLAVLEPLGITNDQLDTVSNYYRFKGTSGKIWTHTRATAVAVLTDGVITSITVTNAGSGYNSAPTITLSDGRTATATLSYGTTLATNGSITAITIN